MALQWEFPGGKIEAGESPEQALARELDEELGIQATIGPRVTHIRHNYRHGGAVDLQFFAVHEFSGEIVNRIFQQVRWTKLEDLPGYDFLAADRGLIRDLAAGKLLWKYTTTRATASWVRSQAANGLIFGRLFCDSIHRSYWS